MDTLTAIKKDIDWYNARAKTATVDQLMKVKSHLVTYNYNLAEQLADMKESYNNAYFLRKIETVKQQNAFIQQGDAANKAKSAAEEEKEQELKDELQKESLAYRLDVLLRQSNRVVDDIQQRISVLKKEFDNSKTQ